MLHFVALFVCCKVLAPQRAFRAFFVPHKMLDSDQANKLNSRLHVLFGCFSIFVGVSPWWGSKNILQLKSESHSQSYNTHLLLGELPCAVFLIRFVFFFFYRVWCLFFCHLALHNKRITIHYESVSLSGVTPVFKSPQRRTN